jgi:hypothetical protein
MVGFDSILFERRGIETPDKVFKANMAASVTVEDEISFRSAYDKALAKIFKEKELKRRKFIYKGYHFRLQMKAGSSDWYALRRIV